MTADTQNYVVIMELVQFREMAVQTELLLRINQENTTFPIAYVASAVLISLGVVERRSH
jgi:hypothetical protein